MSEAVAVLAQHGLSNSSVIVQAAGTVGLEIPKAAALCQKESNGQNIWGHDAVHTGGCYTKGGPVTLENYRCYRKSATAGWQGVGPCQLTHKSFIYEAEAINPTQGASDPITNCLVGFKALKTLQAIHGDQDGARRYNGSGPAAESYGRDFMVKLNEWVKRLAGQEIGGGTTRLDNDLQTLSAGDTNETIWRLQSFLNKTFPHYSRIDAGPGPTSHYGPQTIAVVSEFQSRAGVHGSEADGTSVGPRTWVALLRFGYP